MESGLADLLIGRLWEAPEGSGERFVLAPGGEVVLLRALARAGERLDPWPELEGLLRLIVALDGELESPSVAEQLRAALRGTGWAVDLLARHQDHTRAIDRLRAFRRAEDRAETPAGPTPRAPSSAGGAPARTWMNPHWQDRARARGRH